QNPAGRVQPLQNCANAVEQRLVQRTVEAGGAKSVLIGLHRMMLLLGWGIRRELGHRMRQAEADAAPDEVQVRRGKASFGKRPCHCRADRGLTVAQGSVAIEYGEADRHSGGSSRSSNLEAKGISASSVSGRASRPPRRGRAARRAGPCGIAWHAAGRLASSPRAKAAAGRFPAGLRSLPDRSRVAPCWWRNAPAVLPLRR